jgi:hypothetical protein
MEIEDGNCEKPLNRYMAYGRVSLIFAIAGLLWFVICFSAKEARGWNSLWFLLLIFIFSISLGTIAHRRKVGIPGIIAGSSGPLVVSFLLYVG